MQHLGVVEEELRQLAAESVTKKRQSYPEIKEAADKALCTLKNIREEYVRGRGRGRGEASTNETGSIRRVSGLPQSSDILSPYILACNYADGSTKLLSMALNGIHNLLVFEMIPPCDVKNVLRVLSIQAGSGSNTNSSIGVAGAMSGHSVSLGGGGGSSRLQPDSQLKVLQISLQMLNFLSATAAATEHLTEQTICSFISLALKLCDARNNISVSSAAMVTARQMVSLVTVLSTICACRRGANSLSLSAGVRCCPSGLAAAPVAQGDLRSGADCQPAALSGSGHPDPRAVSAVPGSSRLVPSLDLLALFLTAGTGGRLGAAGRVLHPARHRRRHRRRRRSRGGAAGAGSGSPGRDTQQLEHSLPAERALCRLAALVCGGGHPSAAHSPPRLRFHRLRLQARGRAQLRLSRTATRGCHGSLRQGSARGTLPAPARHLRGGAVGAAGG